MNIGQLVEQTATQLAEVIRGGPDSGHHGHKGRPGEVGGSLPSGAVAQAPGDVRAARKKRLHDLYKRMPDTGNVRRSKVSQDFFAAATTWFLDREVKISLEEIDSVSHARGFRLRDESGNVLTMQLGEAVWTGFKPELILSWIDANNKGTGLGSAFMRACKSYADAKDMTFRVVQVTNPKFYRRFDWLEEGDFSEYFYDPAKQSAMVPKSKSDDEDEYDLRESPHDPKGKQWPPIVPAVERGGPGSGHHGHKGRPGEVGGSLPSGATVSKLQKSITNKFEKALDNIGKKIDVWQVPITASLWITANGNIYQVEKSHQSALSLAWAREVERELSDDERAELDSFAWDYWQKEYHPDLNYYYFLQELKWVRVSAERVGYTGEKLSRLNLQFFPGISNKAIRTIRELALYYEENYKNEPRFDILGRAHRKYEGTDELFANLGITRGGPGSGHRGHEGRPGEVGGSLPSGVAVIDEVSDFGREQKILANYMRENWERKYRIESRMNAGWIDPEGNIYEMPSETHWQTSIEVFEETGVWDEEAVKEVKRIGLGSADPTRELIRYGFVRFRLVGGSGPLIFNIVDFESLTNDQRDSMAVEAQLAIDRGWDVQAEAISTRIGINDIYLTPDVREALGITERGGEGSGHFEHEGRPGEVGGSLPGEGVPRGRIGLTFETWQRQSFDEALAASYADAIEEGYGLTPVDRIANATWIAPDGRALSQGSNHEETSELALAVVDGVDADDFTISETQIIQAGLIRHTFFAYGQETFVISGADTLTIDQKRVIQSIMDTRVNQRASVKIPSGRDTELVGLRIFIVEDVPPSIDPISRELEHVDSNQAIRLLGLSRNEWRTSPLGQGLVVSTAPRTTQMGELITETKPPKLTVKGILRRIFYTRHASPTHPGTGTEQQVHAGDGKEKIFNTELAMEAGQVISTLARENQMTFQEAAEGVEGDPFVFGRYSTEELVKFAEAFEEIGGMEAWERARRNTAKLEPLFEEFNTMLGYESVEVPDQPDTTPESGLKIPSKIEFDENLESEARFEGNQDRIVVGPKFFELPSDASRRAVLAHEIGHTISDAMLADMSAFELQDEGAFIGDFDGRQVEGIQGAFTPGENIAEAYSVYLEEPDWLQEHYPDAYEGIRSAVDRYGFPSSLEDALGSFEGQLEEFKIAPAPEPSQLRTEGASIETGFAGMREGFQISTPQGAAARGILFDADFPGQRIEQSRGELFYVEVPENLRRQGIGTSLALDSLRQMVAHNTKTVNMSAVTPEGQHLIDALLEQGYIEGPIQTSERGKAEYSISIELITRGGPGSGHHGHKGRPGEVGGSLPSDGAGDGEFAIKEGSYATWDEEEWLVQIASENEDGTFNVDVVEGHDRGARYRNVDRDHLSEPDEDAVELWTSKGADGSIDRAVESFGLTDDPNEAGYILPDGTMLDFSGSNIGGSPGRRELDHREIGRILLDDEPGGTEGMVFFMDQTGAVRFHLTSGYGSKADMNIDFAQLPTRAQKETLEYITAQVGFIVWDYTIFDSKTNDFRTVAAEQINEPTFDDIRQVWRDLKTADMRERSIVARVKGILRRIFYTRHYAPKHPGTGTEQQVHAGNGAGSKPGKGGGDVVVEEGKLSPDNKSNLKTNLLKPTRRISLDDILSEQFDDTIETLKQNMSLDEMEEMKKIATSKMHAGGLHETHYSNLRQALAYAIQEVEDKGPPGEPVPHDDPEFQSLLSSDVALSETTPVVSAGDAVGPQDRISLHEGPNFYNDEDGADYWGRDNFPAQYHPDQFEALLNYKSNTFESVNRYLRGTWPHAKPGWQGTATRVLDEQVALIDSVMAENTTPEDIIAFRGMNLEHVAIQGSAIVGSVFMDGGFVSTSLAQEDSLMFAAQKDNGVMARIFVPAGTSATYMDFSQMRREIEGDIPVEEELLLNRGLSFRVIAYRTMEECETCEVDEIDLVIMR